MKKGKRSIQKPTRYDNGAVLSALTPGSTTLNELPESLFPTNLIQIEMDARKRLTQIAMTSRYEDICLYANLIRSCYQLAGINNKF